MPNASLLQVADAAQGSRTLKDALVLLGGTNDLHYDNLTPIYEILEKKLVNLSKKRPVIITSISRKYDLNKYHSTHINWKS